MNTYGRAYDNSKFQLDCWENLAGILSFSADKIKLRSEMSVDNLADDQIQLYQDHNIRCDLRGDYYFMREDAIRSVSTTEKVTSTKSDLCGTVIRNAFDVEDAPVGCVNCDFFKDYHCNIYYQAPDGELGVKGLKKRVRRLRNELAHLLFE